MSERECHKNPKADTSDPQNHCWHLYQFGTMAECCHCGNVKSVKPDPQPARLGGTAH